MKGKIIAALGILCSSHLVGSETTSVPCQVTTSFSQGDQALPNKECLPSYGYPGSTNLGQDYQFFVTASYTYWYSGEDGLDVAATVAFQPSRGQILPSKKEMGIISQDFGYSSGFKIGLGMYFAFDAWELSLDYTYYRREATQSASAPSLNPEQGALLTTNWFLQSSSINQPVACQKLASKWKLGMDWLDATLERPFYQGRSLIVRPFFGLRSAWIRQRVSLTLSEIVNITSLEDKVVSSNHSNSWAIGPRAGLGTSFLIGHGLNFKANFGASLLYTQYTTVKHSEGALAAGAWPVSYSMNSQHTLRPMTELSLGLGWGSYFCSQAYHFNIDATYDFNYLWSQNMIRQLNDMFILGAVGGPGDLFLHGLTIKARFDF